MGRDQRVSKAIGIGGTASESVGSRRGNNRSFARAVDALPRAHSRPPSAATSTPRCLAVKPPMLFDGDTPQENNSLFTFT
jgi:hypothetical protein